MVPATTSAPLLLLHTIAALERVYSPGSHETGVWTSGHDRLESSTRYTNTVVCTEMPVYVAIQRDLGL